MGTPKAAKKPAAKAGTTAPRIGKQTATQFRGRIVKDFRVRYLLHLPKGYRRGGAKRWPMILFLHGAGERGDNVKVVATHGPPKLVAAGRPLPFVVVSPQCAEDDWWSNDVLTALLDRVTATCDVDAARVYLTGLSMGGRGTWMLATECPDRFAAIAPICGWGEPFAAFRLKDMPTWIFHGGKDSVVPPGKSREMYRALRAVGNRDVRLTIYPKADHDSWTATYENPELYEWMLAHRRGV